MTTKQTLSFQTEIKQLLHLMIHSLYSNKEIFLRELISNASDAEDKLRFEAIAHPDLMGKETELNIWIDVDKTARTISIRDNGIGMTQDEVIDHLGTIAKSGTKEFLSRMTGDQAKDAHLIGQFGVGFYSAFIVADRVIVRTLKAGTPSTQGVEWTSKGEGDYTIERIEKAQRGTEVILHLREGEDEFLDGWRLRHIIRKYSDHLMVPILMKKEAVGNEKSSDEYEVVNKATALWTLPKAEITPEQYHEFYKHIAHDFQDPLTWAHNRVEGKQEYISLLYVPAHAPFDAFMQEKPFGLKLYVKRVFIMDDAEQFLPKYLRFIKGVLDSNDLPLNISREILQSNRLVESMKAALTKRVLSMLEKLQQDEPEKYKAFWKAFGSVLKEGVIEDAGNKEQVAKLLHFSSTEDESPEQNVTLDAYIARMKPEQDKIYVITADSLNTAKSSPHLEIFRQKGIEVLLLTDRVDEWLVTHLGEYEGKALQLVTKADLKLDPAEEKTPEEQKEAEKDFESILKQMKDILGAQVKDVRLSHRLTSSPACLVTDENDLNPNLRRMLQQAGQFVPDSKPILEINPKHAFISHLQKESDDAAFKVWTEVLFDQATLAEGGMPQDPGAFVKKLNELLMQGV